MKKIESTLPDWIKNYALPGAIEVDGTLTKENAFWFLLTACCPLIFEAYAILLHPFAINWKVKRMVDSGVIVREEIVDEKDFAKVAWKDFFSRYGKSFDINSAYEIHEELREKFAEGNNWPPYLWYPGYADYKGLTIIVKELIEIYENQLVNYYYFLENTKVWSNRDVLYQGCLSEFENLKNQIETENTPNAIFPDTKDWCIVSDVDLPFTYIGGTSMLIDNICRLSNLEIFKLTPRFKERVKD